MQRILIAALAAALALTGSAVAVGSQLSEFAQSTAQQDPTAYAPPGPPAVGGIAPWMSAWDPLGKVGSKAGDAKGAAFGEKSDAVGMANGAAAEASAGVSATVAGVHADATASAALAFDGDATASGVNDLLAEHAMGLRAPSDALPGSSAPGFTPSPLPDPDPYRPTGALAAFQPPGLDFGFVPQPDDLRAARDAAFVWAGEDAAFAAARYVQAYADVRAFLATMEGYATDTAFAAGDTVLGAAGLTPVDEAASSAGFPWPATTSDFARTLLGGTVPFDAAGHPQVLTFGIGLIEGFAPVADPFPAFPGPSYLDQGPDGEFAPDMPDLPTLPAVPVPG